MVSSSDLPSLLRRPFAIGIGFGIPLRNPGIFPYIYLAL